MPAIGLDWVSKVAGAAGSETPSGTMNLAGTTRYALSAAYSDAPPPPPQTVLPDADLATTGWSTAPLFSKLNDSSDATVITGVSS